ncbi:MAG: hypothetical protein HY606_09865 [Planctomycetes bacterium]|nr:hypothetical protein [Planctomycetota bacterium]
MVRISLYLVISLISFGFIGDDEEKSDELSLEKAKRSVDRAKSNSKSAERALAHLVKMNTEESAQIVLNKIKSIREAGDLYWTCVRAAASFSNKAALDKIAKFILDNKSDCGRDVLYEIGNLNYSDEVASLLIKMFNDGDDDLKILALDHMPAVASKEMAEPLVTQLQLAGGDFKKKIGRTLDYITGQDFGENELQWKTWYNTNKDTWVPVKNKFSGYSGGVITTGLDPGRRDEFRKDIPDDLIIVLEADCKGRCKTVSGLEAAHNFDHIDQILSRMGVPHKVVKKSEFEKQEFKMDSRIALFVNCNQIEEHCICPKCNPGGGAAGNRLVQCDPNCTHEPYRNLLSDEAIKKIKRFVSNGGYLFTEDWGNKEIVSRAWPEYVSVGASMDEKTVDIKPVSGNTSHPYLKKIFSKPPKDRAKGTMSTAEFENLNHNWKVDRESRLMDIKHKDVTILITSPGLGKEDKDNAVAVTFAYGKGGRNNKLGQNSKINTGKKFDRSQMVGGRVLHVLSHFGKQSSEDNEYTIQNLMVNFLIEAIQRYIINNPDYKKPSIQNKN